MSAPDATGTERIAEQVRADFRRNLKWLMEERGMDTVMLASRSGISRNTITRYLTGMRSPSLVNAEIIAATLGVNIGVLTLPNERRRDVWK